VSYGHCNTRKSAIGCGKIAIFAVFDYLVAESSLVPDCLSVTKTNRPMKTELTIDQADRLTDIIGVPKEFAAFMGITIHTDITEMSAEEFAADAEISIDDAEVLLTAATISDEPTIWGAYQTLFAMLN
jgi:5,10-methenyltetrahydromethanopterin hydrogenase